MRLLKKVACLIIAMTALGAVSASGASAADLNAYVDVSPDRWGLWQCYSYDFEADRPGQTQVSPGEIGALDCRAGTGMVQFEDDIVIDFQTDGSGSVSPASGSYEIQLGSGGLACTITVSAAIPITEQPPGILGESWLGSIQAENGTGDVVDSGILCPSPGYDLKIGFFVRN